MNLGTIKTITLDLVNAPGDTDFMEKINNYANMAQMEIAAIEKLKGIKSIIQTASDETGYNSYSMPSDIIELRYVTLDTMKYYDYYIENKKIYIPKSIEGTIAINYYKYPSEIDNTTNDSYEFEINILNQMAIPYYVGSLLIAEDNERLSQSLYGIYVSKLKSIRPEADNEPTTISNVLGW